MLTQSVSADPEGDCSCRTKCKTKDEQKEHVTPRKRFQSEHGEPYTSGQRNRSGAPGKYCHTKLLQSGPKQPNDCTGNRTSDQIERHHGLKRRVVLLERCRTPDE